MLSVGLMQYAAAAHGFYNGAPRMALMNVCVATANIILAGVKA